MKKVGIIENLGEVLRPLSRTEYATPELVMHRTGYNTGNLAFVYATHKLLSNPMINISWETPTAIINSSVDHLIICCANQIGSHVDLTDWAEKISALKIPISLVGIGVQHTDQTSMPNIPAGTKKFLQLVSERNCHITSNISARGKYTTSVLKSIGIDSVDTGCPSLLISERRDLGWDICKNQKNKIKRIAVAAGNPWHEPSRDIEYTLKAIVEKYNGEYIIQHPLEMFQFHFNEIEKLSCDVLEYFDSVYKKLEVDDTSLEFFRRYSLYFENIPQWINFLKKFDLIIGARFHGVMLGITAGIPGCVLSIDSRTEELCDSAKIKFLSARNAINMDEQELLDMSRWSIEEGQNFDINRRFRANAFREFLQNQSLAPSFHLDLLAR